MWGAGGAAGPILPENIFQRYLDVWTSRRTQLFLLLWVFLEPGVRLGLELQYMRHAAPGDHYRGSWVESCDASDPAWYVLWVTSSACMMGLAFKVREIDDGFGIKVRPSLRCCHAYGIAVTSDWGVVCDDRRS
jgi:hypothetical protein